MLQFAVRCIRAAFSHCKFVHQYQADQIKDHLVGIYTGDIISANAHAGD